MKSIRGLFGNKGLIITHIEGFARPTSSASFGT